jgi:hypothetical protein
MLVEERARERPFGRGLAKNGVTLSPEQVLPLLWRVTHREMHFRTIPGGRSPEHQQGDSAHAGKADERSAG